MTHWKKTDDSLVRLADGSVRTMQEARALYPDFDLTRSWALPDIDPLPDEDLGTYLRRIGFSEAQLDYARRSFANATGESLRYISAQGAVAEMRDPSCGRGDFRILDGYDSLAYTQAAGLDIRLGHIVQRIVWGDQNVRVVTNHGIFTADRVVITLPLGVLQSGAVEFDPPLPADKQAALAHIRMGPGIKLVYRFAEPVMAAEIMAYYSPLNPPMWWSPSAGQSESPYLVWTALATGDYCRDLLKDGEAAALQMGLETLRKELNRPDLTPVDSYLVNWVADPYARGVYSVVTPGHSDARLELATPVDNRLFWAGEATAPHGYAATVHGAYASGKRVAQEIISLMESR
jgi:monoamine oxidase